MMRKYFFLFLAILLSLQNISAADFQEVNGNEMQIFEEHNRNSYNLFENNIQPATEKIYLKTSSGLAFASDIKYAPYPYIFKQDHYSIPYSLGIGIKFSKFLNIELYGDSRLTQDMKLSHNTDYVTYRLNTHGIGVFLSMDLMQSYDLVPYIGVGGGIYWNDWKVIEQTTKFADEADIPQKIILNYRLVIGTRYKINQNLSLFGEYIYRKIGDLKEEDLFSNDFCLGILVQ
jgi:opacity protein-like surface antigen